MRRIAVTAAAAAFALVLAAITEAQQPGFTRKLLQDKDLSAPDRHAVQAMAEFVPGGAVGRHTHPGEELGYVVEGSLLLEVDGEPSRTVSAGDVFFVEAGKVHAAKNAGSGPAKVFATYVVEKGKPVASAAK